MAASLDFSVDPSLPVSDNVPAVASERLEKTGFSRVRSFWDKPSSQNEDDGSLQRTVPFNKIKNAPYAFRKNQAHLSSLDDANKHKVNNDTCSTGEENRDEDNTSSIAMLPSTHDVAEGRDQLDIDEGNDSFKGTTNDTALPAVQEKCNMVLQQPPHHHRDLREEDFASVTSFPNNSRDPSNMDEGNVSLQGDVKHDNPILPSMHEESQRDFHIPFHYHRDPTEDGATKMILGTDERDPSDMNEGSVSLQGATELIDKSLLTTQEESHVYFQLPFHYHRDPPEESATEIVAATNLGDPANILKENGSFQGASEPNEVSFETLQEEPDKTLPKPFHYHRDFPVPVPEERSSKIVSEENSVSNRAATAVEVSFEGIVLELPQTTSENDEIETSKGTSEHQNSEKVLPDYSSAYGIANTNISESSRQECSARESMVNPTNENNETGGYAISECSHDDELRLVTVVSMIHCGNNHGTAEKKAELQGDLPEMNDIIQAQSFHLDDMKTLVPETEHIEELAFHSYSACPEQKVSDGDPLHAPHAGNEQPLSILVDSEPPVLRKNASCLDESREHQIATMESAIQKQPSTDTTSVVIGVEYPLSTPQLSTCSTSSGVASSYKSKSGSAKDKPEIPYHQVAQPKTCHTNDEVESGGDDDKPASDSMAGLETHYTNENTSWDDDARKMHKLHDIEQRQFESKFQWVLDTIFCGSLDNVNVNYGHKVSKGLAAQANDFVPKHFASIFQEENMSLAAQTKDMSRYDLSRAGSSDIDDDVDRKESCDTSLADPSTKDWLSRGDVDVKARVANRRDMDYYIDRKASVSPCSDTEHLMYIHASPTNQSDMTDPTVFSGRSLTAQESIHEIHEQAKSLLLKFRSTRKSAEEIQSQIWNHLPRSIEYPTTTSFDTQELSSSLSQAKSQLDQTMYQIWNQIRTTRMGPSVQGQTIVDQKQRPYPIPEEIVEGCKDADDYQCLPVSPTGCTNRTASPPPREQLQHGYVDRCQGDHSAGRTQKGSSLAPNEQSQDGDGDLSIVPFSADPDDPVTQVMIPPVVGDAITSLFDMWGKVESSLNQYVAVTPSPVTKSHIAVQTSPSPSPIPSGNNFTSLSAFRPLPPNGNASPLGVRPVSMQTFRSYSCSSLPTSKASSILAVPAQHAGQGPVLTSPVSCNGGAFDVVQPMALTYYDDTKNGILQHHYWSDDIEIADHMISRYNGSSSVTSPVHIIEPTFTRTAQSLPPPHDLPELYLSTSTSIDEDKSYSNPQDQEVAQTVSVEQVGNKPVALSKTLSRLGRLGGIGRSVAKGARRTFGRTKKPSHAGAGTSTASVHSHSTKS